ncbi:hypothetical protein EYZ11_002606 [Aspergillus tanneri]|uniref:Transcription factor domain-containing protein n=1 Tax=Aspergillus tanneri TaxID=1220188 RepID=A0A4S3JSG6_9EURO|nr:hypothetical protein EYZ11_002606 [Aspergillus tanneri]
MTYPMLKKTPDTGWRQTWRRTWWSVYNYAQLTAHDLLAMMRIKENCDESQLFDTTMINLDDFQFSVSSPEARAVVDYCEVICTIEYQVIQAQVFIEKTRLCQLSQFSRVSSQVSNLVHETNGPDDKVSSTNPIPHPDEAEKLQKWQLQLPSAAQLQYPAVMTPTEWERSIYLHRTWLRLLYLGSVYASGFIPEPSMFFDGPAHSGANLPPTCS